MNPETDAERFYNALDAALEVTGKSLSSPAKRMWWHALAEYPIEDVERAIYKHVQNPDHGQFMPKPADVVRAIEGDTESTALSAWHKVLRGLQIAGSWDSVIFDDPCIHACVHEMGGWMDLGARVTEDEEPFFRQQFVKLYRGKRNNLSAYPAKLIGRAEAQNNKEGWGAHNDPPKLIGDQERAKQVYHKGTAGAVLPVTQAPEQLTQASEQIGQEKKRLEVAK